jgi:hypothetical protein
MRHLTSAIAAVALASAAVAFAQQQTPAPAQPPATAPQPPATEQAPKSTVTGCVMQAKTTDGGTAFILTKAEGGSATTYVLGGSSQSDANWSANVNKKVEVTGPVQEPASAAGADPKVLRPPLIVVESVKVVAQSCS